jgi:hypothetical protein
MAHFAKLTEDNVVDVVVVSNSDCLDENGVESESVGIEYCNNLLGTGTWVQTSFNANFRGSFASIGGSYSTELDIFISALPIEGGILDTETGQYMPLTPEPDESPGSGYIWVYQPTSASWEKYQAPGAMP